MLNKNLSGNGLDWLCYLAGNSQMAPMIFFIFSGYFFFLYFIKNPQTTMTPTFLMHIISAIGGVRWLHWADSVNALTYLRKMVDCQIQGYIKSLKYEGTS